MRKKRKYEKYQLPEHPKYAYAYARYSSAAQNDMSIEQQNEAIQQFADREGITVLAWYEDRALSGTNDQRPGLQRMLADVIANNTDRSKDTVEAIIVWKTDRFARNSADYAVHTAELVDVGCYLYKVAEPNVSGSVAPVINGQMAAYAETYSIQTSENICRGMDASAEACKCVTRLPYGYHRDSDGHYAITPEEAPIVREIYARYAGGEGLQTIADSLNARAIPRHPRKVHGQIVSDGWTINTLRSILDNARYKGVYVYHEEETGGTIPAIVDAEVWQAAADAKAAHAYAPRHKVGGDVDDYVLSGKITCGLCGCDMVGDSGTGRHGAKYRYYSCRRKRGRKGCNNRGIKAEALEKLVAERVQSIALSDQAIDTIAADVIDAQKMRKKNSPLALLRRQRDELAGAVSNLVSAIAKGVSSPALLVELERLEGEKAKTEAAIAAEEANDITVTKAQVQNWLKKFRRGNVHNAKVRQKIIANYVDRVIVGANNIQIIIGVFGQKVEVEELRQKIEEKRKSDNTPPSDGDGSDLVGNGPPLQENPNFFLYGNQFGFLFCR